MINVKLLKPNNEICLKSEYQFKQKTISRQKMLQLIKKAFFEKWILSFQMVNVKLLKPNNEIRLKCEYQFKQKTISREKML